MSVCVVKDLLSGVILFNFLSASSALRRIARRRRSSSSRDSSFVRMAFKWSRMEWPCAAYCDRAEEKWFRMDVEALRMP